MPRAGTFLLASIEKDILASVLHVDVFKGEVSMPRYISFSSDGMQPELEKNYQCVTTVFLFTGAILDMATGCL